MKNVIKFNVFLLLFLALLFAGCGLSQKQQSQQQITKGERKQVNIKPNLAEEIKKVVLTVKGVKDSTVVVINKDVSAAIKVTGFDRFRLKTIKKEVHKKIKEFNKDFNVHVTSDKKIFMRLRQIENQINGPQEKSTLDILDIQKKVDRLNKDMSG